MRPTDRNFIQGWVLLSGLADKLIMPTNGAHRVFPKLLLCCGTLIFFQDKIVFALKGQTLTR